MKVKFTFLLVSGLLTLSAASAKRIYVRPMDSNAWNSQSGVQSVKNLGEITGIESGDELWLAAGTYAQEAPFTPLQNLTVMGGFAGTETDAAQRERIDLDNNGIVSPWEFKNATILDGAMGDVKLITFRNAGAVVDGVTLTNVASIELVNNSGGAGAYFAAENCVLRNSHLNRCFTERKGSNNANGGAITMDTPGVVDGCLVENSGCLGNKYKFAGGGIAILSATGVVKNSTIRNCVVPSTTYEGVGGGGIYMAGEGIIENCAIHNNYAPRGGGVYMGRTKSTHDDVKKSTGGVLYHCTIVNNVSVRDNSAGVFGFYSGVAYNTLIANNYKGGAAGVTDECSFFSSNTGALGAFFQGVAYKGALSPKVGSGSAEIKSVDSEINEDGEYIREIGADVHNVEVETLASLALRKLPSVVGNVKIAGITVQCVHTDESLLSEVEQANFTFKDASVLKNNGSALRSKLYKRDEKEAFAVSLPDYAESVTDARGIAKNTATPSIGAFEYDPDIKNVLPTVSIALFGSEETSIRLEDFDGLKFIVDAKDAGGAIEEVRILRNGDVVATLTEAPYNYMMDEVLPNGIYSFTAEATDDEGGIGRSEAVSVEFALPPQIAKRIYVRMADDATSWSKIDLGTYDKLLSVTGIDEIKGVVDGDEIFIAAGTYVSSATFAPKANVKIYGGFEGTEASIDLSARVRSDLDENQLTDKWEMLHPTVITSAEGADVRLMDLRRDGIVIDGLTFQDALVKNYDAQGGAALLISGQHVVVRQSTFRKLTAGGGTAISGGAVQMNTPAMIDYCLFESCTAANSPASNGGAVAILGATGTIKHSIFRNMRAEKGKGGALYVQNDAVVEYSLFHNNNGDLGGAIYGAADASKAGVQLYNCTVVENCGKKALNGGSGVYTNGSGVVFNSIIVGNINEQWVNGTTVNAKEQDIYIENLDEITSTYFDGLAYGYTNVNDEDKMFYTPEPKRLINTQEKAMSNFFTAPAGFAGVDTYNNYADNDEERINAIRKANYTLKADAAINTTNIAPFVTSYKKEGNGDEVALQPNDFSKQDMQDYSSDNQTLGAYEFGTLTSIAEQGAKSEQGISYYPNPVSDLLTVNATADAKIAVYTLSGAKLATVTTDMQGIAKIDMSGYPQGVYFLQVVRVQVVESYKVIKK